MTRGNKEPPRTAERSFDDELERLFDHSLDAVCLAGLDGFFRQVNRGFARLLGYSREELLARPFLDHVHPDDLEATRAVLAELAGGKDLVSFESRLVTADGWVRSIEWQATPFEEGVIFGVGRDVTERNLATEQISALRRVATLVAEATQPHDLFALVAAEVERVVDVPAVSIASYETDDSVVYLAVSAEREGFSVGMRQPLDGSSVVAEIRTTHEPARIDDYSELDGSIAELMRQSGGRSTVGSPIVVAGRLWGAMVVSTSAPEPLPPDTEARLADFTELLGAAIANAESRDALERLAEEQAALRRVATLAAQAVHPTEIFDAVSREVAQLFRTDAAYVGRFDPDGPAIVAMGVANWEPENTVGMRWELDDSMSTAKVFRTGRSARVDGADRFNVTAPIGALARRMRTACAVSSPITVDGRLWGAMSVAAREPLPPDTAMRLEKFTALVATAIANAESRDALERLAEEQSALRRAATMVVEGVPPEVIFSTVSDEVGRLFASETSVVMKFEHDPPSIVVAGVGGDPPVVPIGTRIALDYTQATRQVYLTGRSARVDARDFAQVPEPFGGTARRLGLTATVASPIIVEGRLWGVNHISATTPFPAGTEARLERFSDVLATAIANAESRQALERLAAEQSALQRIATLVAQGAAAATVFTAVSDEVAELYGEGLAAVGRFAADGSSIMVVGVASGVEWLAVGRSIDLSGSPETPAALVYSTGHSARVDWAAATSEAAKVDAKGHSARVDWSASTSDYALPGSIVSSVACPIIVEGRLWGAVSTMARTKPLPFETETRLERFSDLLATAIANAESKSELAASRRRIVAASDAARRQIERDLHDGTQQRLVALGLAVRTAEADVPEGCDDLRSELSRIATGLTEAVTELQEMSRGIHPAILSQGGLAAALRALARRSAVPVQLYITTDARPPEPIEVAAYYVASEAIANATKHAQASRIDLSLTARNGGLQLSVRDDGVGGADPRRGSGLVGLSDRVEAVGGSIRVESPRGDGTRITAELPLDLEPQAAADDL